MNTAVRFVVGRPALGQGHLDIRGESSNSGGFELRHSKTVLNVSESGTLGTGPVVASDGAAPTVNFSGQYKKDVPALSLPLGRVTISDFRVNLTDDIFKSPDLSWWLDSSNAETMDLDAGNRVSECRSANGNGVAFAPSVFGEDGVCSAPTFTSSDPIDSLPGVSFCAAETNGLAASVKMSVFAFCSHPFARFA